MAYPFSLGEESHAEDGQACRDRRRLVYTTTEAVGENQTRVKSVYIGKMNDPTNLLCSFVEDKIGQDMREGLENLKRVLEAP